MRNDAQVSQDLDRYSETATKITKKKILLQFAAQLKSNLNLTLWFWLCGCGCRSQNFIIRHSLWTKLSNTGRNYGATAIITVSVINRMITWSLDNFFIRCLHARCLELSVLLIKAQRSQGNLKLFHKSSRYSPFSTCEDFQALSLSIAPYRLKGISYVDPCLHIQYRPANSPRTRRCWKM